MLGGRLSCVLPKEQPVTVVFVFHGGSGVAAGTMGLSRFNTVADREKFIVVYPQGIGRSRNDGQDIHAPACRR